MIKFLKLIGVTFLLSSPFLVSAQFQVGVGGTYVFNDKVFTNGLKYPGISARVGYAFSPQFSFQGDFNYYFLPGDFKDQLNQIGTILGVSIGVNAFDFNLNGQYFFKTEKSGFNPYAVAGLSVLNAKETISGGNANTTTIPGYSETSSHIGFNIGVGATFPFADRISGYAEVKDAINNLGIIASAGILFDLGSNDGGNTKTKKGR